ncbi:hypothetical protein BANRA_02366 [Escherichia coli]|nr:hypothetical protein BANRA_02366 [Escherichia coli]
MPGSEPELLYLNANRLGAQEFVPTAERRVGVAGEFLFSTFDKMKHLPVPEYLVKVHESTTLAYQLSYWLKLITGTTSELVTEKVGDQIKVAFTGNDSNLLIVFYVQIMPDDFVMQLHRF